MPPFSDPMLHFCRSAAQSTAELANLYLGSMERMQNAQATAAITEARQESDKAVKQMQSASSLQELYQLQAHLARTHTEKIIGYWSALYSSTHLTQVEFMRQAQVKGLEWMDAMSHAMDGAHAPEPMMNAMRMVASAARNGYGSILRATEETVERAAAEAERSVSAGMPPDAGSGGQEGGQGSSQAAA